MSEATTKTALLVGTAFVLVIAAWVTTPRITPPDIFSDLGSSVFPAFTDPTTATSLEVIQFNEETATARPFKVQVLDGLWTIPSQFNYPADGRDRLSKIAAAIIALKKDTVATERVAEHERTGTLDPLDETLPTLKGRGTRVTIKGESERVLADIILGNPLGDRPTFRYVRLPQQNRVYVAEVGDLNISTAFHDWIDRDLLQVEWDAVNQVIIRDYSLNETTRAIDLRDVLFIEKAGADAWALRGGDSDEAVDTFRMNLLVTALDQLSIIGIQPKPAGISAELGQATGGLKVSQEDVQELASKGFYVTPNGQLVSNEGELLVHTRNGIVYTLRFGEIAYVNGDALASDVPQGPDTSAESPPPRSPADRVVADSEPAAVNATTADPNRYLFITASFNSASTLQGPDRTTAQERAAQLRDRFAPWYYVISGNSFQRIHLQRKDLVTTRADDKQIEAPLGN